MVLNCCALRPALVPSLLHFVWFDKNSFIIKLCDSYCNTIDMVHINHRSNDIQYYTEINITQYESLVVLTLHQICLRYTSDFPILVHCLQNAPMSLSKSSLIDVFAFA